MTTGFHISSENSLDLLHLRKQRLQRSLKILPDPFATETRSSIWAKEANRLGSLLGPFPLPSHALPYCAVVVSESVFFLKNQATETL